MKMFSCFVFALFVVVGLTPVSGFASDQKIRMAVLAFSDNSQGSAPASAIQDMMVGELAKVPQFSIIERAKIENIGAEQRMSAQGLVDSNTAVEVGRLTGAKYLITGSITQYHYEASAGAIPIGGFAIAIGSEEGHVAIDLRVIDSKTSEVVLTSRRTGVANQTQGGIASQYGGFATGKGGGLLSAATYKCVGRLVQDLKSKLLGSKGAAAVLNADGKEVMCNIGDSNGSVSVGDIYVAYREGMQIKDLDGKVLGAEQNYLCAFKITKVEPNYSTGVLVKGCLPRRGALVTNAPDGWKNIKYASDDVAPDEPFDIDKAIKEKKLQEKEKTVNPN